MLDLDASFAFVPEFQSTRRRVAERALLSRDGLFGADVLTSAVFPAIAVPECDKVAPAVKSFALSEILTPDGDAEIAQDHGFGALCAFAPDHGPEEETQEEALSLFSPAEEPEAEVPDVALQPEARAVTPRRPLRFTSAREGNEAAPVSLPNLNLFDGIFDTATLDAEAADPRLLRSRARALSRLSAYEAALPPEQRNLWHEDAIVEAPAPAPQAVPEAQPALAMTEAVPAEAEAIQPRRAVRHIAVKRDSEARPAPVVAFADPLQDQLHRVRDALYIADAEEIAAAAEQAAQKPALLQRVMAIVLHLAVMLFTLPGRLAERLETVLPAQRRGYNLRLAAVAGLVAAVALFLTQGDPGTLS